MYKLYNDVCQESPGELEVHTLGVYFSVSVDLPWQREKENKIIAALESDPVDIATLRTLALSLGGLLHSRMRKKVWPKLAGLNVFYIASYKGAPLSGHRDRSQILLDVNRCGKRIPKRN